MGIGKFGNFCGRVEVLLNSPGVSVILTNPNSDPTGAHLEIGISQ